MRLRDLLTYYFKEPKVPNADEIAVEQLEDMNRQLLDVQKKKEYYSAQETALITGIRRLEQRERARTVNLRSVGNGQSVVES